MATRTLTRVLASPFCLSDRLAALACPTQTGAPAGASAKPSSVPGGWRGKRSFHRGRQRLGLWGAKAHFTVGKGRGSPGDLCGHLVATEASLVIMLDTAMSSEGL